MQRPKSVAIEFIDRDDSLDVEFKPGLFKQTELFLKGANHNNFVTIQSHLENVIRHFEMILRPN